MITESDIKTDLRDLIYIEEEIYNLLNSAKLPKRLKTEILDNLKEKQVIITKLIHFFSTNTLK